MIDPSEQGQHATAAWAPLEHHPPGGHEVAWDPTRTHGTAQPHRHNHGAEPTMALAVADLHRAAPPAAGRAGPQHPPNPSVPRPLDRDSARHPCRDAGVSTGPWSRGCCWWGHRPSWQGAGPVPPQPCRHSVWMLGPGHCSEGTVLTMCQRFPAAQRNAVSAANGFLGRWTWRRAAVAGGAELGPASS